MVQSAEAEISMRSQSVARRFGTGRQTKMLVGGVNYVSERVTLKNAQLWWPNGYGAQNLCTFTARCTARGITHEMPEKRIGIRTVELSTPRSSRTARAISSSK